MATEPLVASRGGVGFPVESVDQEGATVFYVVTAPLTSLGNDGDVCFSKLGIIFFKQNGAWISSTGGTGPQGSQGTQGNQGDTGSQGPQGFQGNQGNQGNQGQAGSSTGTQGPQGAQGATGAQGTTGPQGATGVAGPQGNIGSQGPQGAPPSPGSTGFAGNQALNHSSSVAIIAANSTRREVTITNDSGSETVYIALGVNAVVGSGIRLNPNGGSYTTDLFLGQVNGICTNLNGGTATAMVSEIRP